MDVRGNTININNPNINIPGSVAKALTNIGTDAAIGGGMSAGANAIKGSALPSGIKFVTTVARGVATGAIVTATNAANTIAQNNIRPNPPRKSGSGSSCTVNCVTKDVEGSCATIDTVITFLNSNFVLYISILYLLFALAILYLFDQVVKNQ
jgi:hypothetical protein